MNQTPQHPRPDWSMSLLEDVREGALEPEYRDVAPQRRTGRLTRLTAAMMAAAVLVLAVVSGTRTADARAAEQRELATLLTAERERLAELDAEITALTGEIRELSEAQIADPDLMARLGRLEPTTGAVGVVGPGIIITVNDAPGRADREGLVLDSDLSRMVNGLRQAGAEAVAINGRRITSTTPIRTAGAAITVDYVSLSPPYRVEAIGDPAQLQSRFGRTSAASWWYYLSRSYGVEFDIAAASEELELAAVPQVRLLYATKGE